MFSPDPADSSAFPVGQVDRQSLVEHAESPRPLMSEELSDSGRDLKDDALVVNAAVFGRAVDIAALVEH